MMRPSHIQRKSVIEQIETNLKKQQEKQPVTKNRLGGLLDKFQTNNPPQQNIPEKSPLPNQNRIITSNNQDQKSNIIQKFQAEKPKIVQSTTPQPRASDKINSLANQLETQLSNQRVFGSPLISAKRPNGIAQVNNNQITYNGPQMVALPGLANGKYANGVKINNEATDYPKNTNEKIKLNDDLSNALNGRVTRINASKKTSQPNKKFSFLE